MAFNILKLTARLGSFQQEDLWSAKATNLGIEVQVRGLINAQVFVAVMSFKFVIQLTLANPNLICSLKIAKKHQRTFQSHHRTFQSHHRTFQSHHRTFQSHHWNLNRVRCAGVHLVSQTKSCEFEHAFEFILAYVSGLRSFYQ